MFAYYSAMYALLSLAMTVLSVPYLALQPEMALGYDARTSLNTYRNAGSVIGVCAAVAFRPIANALGGGPSGFAIAGLCYGAVLTLPWFMVFAVTWERPEFSRCAPRMSLRAGISTIAHDRAFRPLVGFYLCGRIAMDLMGAMLPLYFTYFLGRSQDFEPLMGLSLGAVLVSLPFWLRLSRTMDKSTTFIAGSILWMISLLLILFVEPSTPRWVPFALAMSCAIGYAVVDLIPWSMLGEVVDRDELGTGERREGIYYGLFTFLRKVAGSIAVALALLLLGAVGFSQGEEQNAEALEMIRVLTSLGPALFLGLAVWIARGYPLTREVHGTIVAKLLERDAETSHPE
jgi:Na+/melibiose symporter-like transporter